MIVNHQPSTITMIKRQKLDPCIINSRAALETVIADVVKLKIEQTQATAAMQEENPSSHP